MVVSIHFNIVKTNKFPEGFLNFRTVAVQNVIGGEYSISRPLFSSHMIYKLDILSYNIVITNIPIKILRTDALIMESHYIFNQW